MPKGKTGPSLTPRSKLAYETTEACEALGICEATFCKYRALLGTPVHKRRRMRGRKGSWKHNYYLYPDLLKIADLIYPLKDRYRLSMQQRVELELAKNCTKSDKI